VLRLLGLTVALACLGCATAAAQGAEGAADKIRIVSVTPAKPVVVGVKNEFTVEVEYDLRSSEKGEVNLGFSAGDDDRYRVVKVKDVKRGAGSLTLKAKAVPRRWGERGFFFCHVNLSKRPHDNVWKALVMDKREIPLTDKAKDDNQ